MVFHVSVGRDAFGRVKVIDETPVVTVFTTINLIPLYPRSSFYIPPHGGWEWACEPLPSPTGAAVVLGMPLGSLDRASVVMAYLRAVFALLTLSGLLLLFPAIHALMGDPPDEPERVAAWILAAATAVGVVGGASSYALPHLPAREGRIRRYCGECLGAAVDPARLRGDRAGAMIDLISSCAVPGDSPRTRLTRDLARTRARLASAGDDFELEDRTDRLLDELDHLDRAGV